MIRKFLCLVLVMSLLFTAGAVQAVAAGEHIVDILGNGAAYLAVTDAGRVLSWGGSMGWECGLGYTVQYIPPTEAADISDKFDGERVVDCKKTLDASIVLTADGSVFSWGRNNDGNCGNGHKNITTTPSRIGGLPKIRKLFTSTGNCMFAISDTNTLYFWGQNGAYNDFAQNEISEVLTPQPLLENVQEFSYKGGAYLVLTTDHRILTWGNNSYGECCIDYKTTKQVDTITDVTSKFPAKIVSAALKYAIGTVGIAISEDNRVFTWGNNTKGGVGNGRIDRDVYYDSPVEITSSLPAISGRWESVTPAACFLLGDGKLFAWGNNTYGERGCGPTVPVKVPTQILSNETVQSVAGEDYYMKVLTEDGKLYTFGSGQNGLHGNGSSENITEPTEITEYIEGQIEWIKWAGYSFFLRTTDKVILAWGLLTNFTQLGQNRLPNPINISTLLPLDADYNKYFLSSQTIEAPTGVVQQPDYIIDSYDAETDELVVSGEPLDKFVFLTPDKNITVDYNSGSIKGIDVGNATVYAILKSKAAEVGMDYTNPDFSDWVVPIMVTVTEGKIDHAVVIDLLCHALTFSIAIS